MMVGSSYRKPPPWNGNLEWLWPLAICLCLLLTAPLRAQLVVTDPGVLQATIEVLGQTHRLHGEAVRANRSLETLVRYEGNPRDAVQRIERLGSFVTNIGRMGQPRYRADALARELTAEEGMVSTDNPYRTQLGENVQVYGQSQPREHQAYAERLAEESMWVGVRDQREVNRQHKHTLLGRLSTVNQKLERSDTHQEVLAAQIEMERLLTLMKGAQFLADNVQADAEARTELRRLAQEDERARNLEEAWLRAQARRQYRAEREGARVREKEARLRSGSAAVAPRF